PIPCSAPRGTPRPQGPTLRFTGQDCPPDPLPAPDGPRIVPGMTVTLETLLATLLTEVRTRRAATLSLDDLATHVERARRYGRDRLAHRGP
ncbi:hypothetical protein L6V77_34840, partial [Myxococcota bacterium]|nr:hypothetical protein [Myxococcota bacterium]